MTFMWYVCHYSLSHQKFLYPMGHRDYMYISLHPRYSAPVIPVHNVSQELYAITPSVLRHSVLISFSLNGLPWVCAVTYWEPSAQEFSMTQ